MPGRAFAGRPFPLGRRGGPRRGRGHLPVFAERAPLEIERIAEDDLPVPGLPGTTFTCDSALLGPPLQLACEGRLYEGEDPVGIAAIVRLYDDGAVELIAREGDPSPIGGDALGRVTLLGFNREGELLLAAQQEVPTLGYRYFGPGPAGPLDQLACDGCPLPGFPPNEQPFPAGDLRFGDDGSLAFATSLLSGSGSGLWRSRPASGLEAVLSPGDPAPGLKRERSWPSSAMSA